MPVVFILFIVLICLFYLGVVTFLAIGLHNLAPSAQPNNLTYSVIIAAHNEEKNIEQCLTHVFSQTIPTERFEVILAADRCSDATVSIASRFRDAGKKLTIVDIAQTAPGYCPKKYALTQAIRLAKNEILVFTDADCIVLSTWLETIDRNFPPETVLVQGITTYSRPATMGRFLFGFQALDFLSHGVVSAAAIGAGLPINSNANNLSVRKSTFETINGYATMRDVVSGDDDLLVQSVSRKFPGALHFMTDKAGAVTTLPTPTAHGVFEQRKRWGSKTVYYGPMQVALLSWVFLFYVAIATIFCIGFFKPVFFLAFAAMMTVKCIGESLLMAPGTRIFGQQHLRPLLPVASFLQLPMVLGAIFGGVFGKFKWKDTVFSRKTTLEPNNPEKHVS